jgi:hypothetical protein
MSKIIDFYDGISPDSENRMLFDILAQPLDWMEMCHDYIQWLFPLKEESNFNPDAPLLTDEDIREFKNRFGAKSIALHNFTEAIEKMLYFLGIDIFWDGFELDAFQLAINFEKQKYTWLGPVNHNALRITRMLSCLSILGFEKLAGDLLVFMKEKAPTVGGEISPRSIEYWEKALLVR